LKTNLLLAPIARYTDLAYRIVCREWGGVGLAYTDLLSPRGLLRGTATSLALARTDERDRPLGMQIYGSDPAVMADGARWAIDHGADLIDINMGCPVDKVTKKDGGSKLLCDSTRAARIVEAVVEAVRGADLPVTAKLRLGWAEGDLTAPALARDLVEAGVAGVTVHGRYALQRFKGTVDLSGIAAVVEAVAGRVPVIGNGDVTEPADVVAMIERTGCDGVMIGRGALVQPWLFRDAWSLLTTGVVPEPPTEVERIETIRRFFQLMLEFRGERYAMHQIRRRISWLSKPLREPRRPIREAIRTAEGPGDVGAALDRHLLDCDSRAADASPRSS
jgi:nifR3 family TIM-barrel protein